MPRTTVEELDPELAEKYTEAGWVELGEDGQPLNGAALPEPLVEQPS